MRACAQCGGSLEGMRSHAVYCSRACKTRASDARRNADGRAGERDRARYVAEGERRREYARQYLATNPERMRTIRLRRKQRQRLETCLVTERDWRRLQARYDHRCAYCGRSAPLTRDHVIPLARGGRHSIGNILPACGGCNMSKKARLLSDWRYRVLPSRR